MLLRRRLYIETDPRALSLWGDKPTKNKETPRSLSNTAWSMVTKAMGVSSNTIHGIVPSRVRKVVCSGPHAYLALGHYSDVIMNAMASQITGVSLVYSTVCSGADQRKHQSSASLAFVRGIHRWPVNSPHKGPVTRKMFPFWWRHHDISNNHDNLNWSLLTYQKCPTVIHGSKPYGFKI